MEELVAPARERGLKLAVLMGLKGLEIGRSRKGAWIEIARRTDVLRCTASRSRKGAWIEIWPIYVCLKCRMSLPQGSVD